MSRARQICALTIVVLLSVSMAFGMSSTAFAISEQEAADGEDLYVEALNNSEEPRYNAQEVKMGTVAKQDTVTASIYYPKYKTISIPASYGTVQFGKMLVKTGDMVKKGSPVARFTTNIDKVSLEEQKRSLIRLETSYHRFVTNRSEGLRDQKKALNDIEDKKAKHIAELEYKNAQLEYKSAKSDQERQIDKLKQQIKKGEAIRDVKELVAPIDGYISSVSSIKPGDKIDYKQILIKVADPSVIYFRVTDKSFCYGYNLKVTLEVNPGDSGSERTITGRVISSTLDSGSQNEENATSYIKPDEKITLDDVKNKKIEATIDVCIMDNVLVAPVDAVLFDEDAPLLDSLARTYELQDGSLVERLFIPGLRNTEFCQVITGLDEGTKIVKKQ